MRRILGQRVDARPGRSPRRSPRGRSPRGRWSSRRCCGRRRRPPAPCVPRPSASLWRLASSTAFERSGSVALDAVEEQRRLAEQALGRVHGALQDHRLRVLLQRLLVLGRQILAGVDDDRQLARSRPARAPSRSAGCRRRPGGPGRRPCSRTRRFSSAASGLLGGAHGRHLDVVAFADQLDDASGAGCRRPRPAAAGAPADRGRS